MSIAPTCPRATSAGANPANYEYFGIQRDGLLLRFSSYQVAPYAIGEPEVLVPYAELKDALAPNSPITSIMAANRL